MKQKIKIIGVSGTNGSGKDTVSEMLAERHNYLFADATVMLAEELKRRGLPIPIDRKNKSGLSAEWRRKYGMGVIVDKAVELFNSKPGKYSGIAVGSLRHSGEAESVHSLGGIVVWVDAEARVRFDRIQRDQAKRSNTHAAEKDFGKFLAQQEREMTHVGDSATLNMAAVKDLADVYLENNGNDINVFNDLAEQKLLKYL